MTTRVSRPLFEGTHNLGRVSQLGYTFEAHQCGTCGVVWALDIQYLEARREDHEGWLCPNGHSFVFNGPSETERLRQQLERERTRSGRIAAERDQIEASRRAVKGVVTKLKKRISAGVCPCCNRTFKQLADHMATQHPDYLAATIANQEPTV